MVLQLQWILILALCGTALAENPFWTRKRKIEVGIYVAAIGVDGWKTQTCRFCTERNPLARPFVHSSQGEIVAASLGVAAGIGPSYLLHRLGHERMSRLWLHAFTVGETINAAHQIYLFH